MIRGPLRELRDAATLPPEELKRRDEAKEARRKAEAEAEARRQTEAAAKAAEEAQRKQREQEDAAKLAGATVVEPPRPAAAEVITAGGTMIASPPPTDELRTLTPLPEMHSPAPVVAAAPPRLPRPPLPPPKAVPPHDATIFDLQAQLRPPPRRNATLAGRPVLAPHQSRPVPPRPARRTRKASPWRTRKPSSQARPTAEPRIPTSGRPFPPTRRPRPAPRRLRPPWPAARPGEAAADAGRPDEKRMSFLEHLSELRSRLRNAALAFLVATIASFIFVENYFDWLTRPVRRACATPGTR